MEKPIFDNEKLLKVFIWCILKAYHTETEQLIGKQLVLIKSGQFPTGRIKAGIELNMSPSTVWQYLKLLESNKTIDIKSNNKFSIISIVNWELYQSQDENLDSKIDNKSYNKITSNEQQNNTNKNIKNIKNDKNNINNTSSLQKTESETQLVIEDVPPAKPKVKKSEIKSVFSTEDKEYKLACYLSKQIAKRLDKPLQEEQTLQKWSIEFERMVRRDGYDINEIKDVLVFSQKDPFWQDNIMSASKFRKQYLTLLGKMKKDDES